MKKFISMLYASAIIFSISAAEPDGYYTSCENKKGDALLKALASKVSSHTNVGYDGLWAVYDDSDRRADGTLWDIYSTKAWPKKFATCGNYKLVGDCVNREHSLPKSWWGGGSKTVSQYSDAYHLYPTDGKVNGDRSNYPYGECSGGKTVAPNGDVKALGRRGTCTFPGYTGMVFEPDDEYKGDLARSYFYMATAYNSIISGWTQGNGKDFFAGNSFPVFKAWALELLLKWHRQDPVSDKEIDRNEAIYKHQKNRNPYIDHPELVEYIWGNKASVVWTLNATSDPEIISPVENSVIDLGTTAIGYGRSKQVAVKGVSLTENITVSVAGSGFSVSPAIISAVSGNQGSNITVTYKSSSTGSASGQLILKTGAITAAYTLLASAIDGLPAGPARNVSDSGFDATWSCITDENDTYTLNVLRDGVSVAGYPVQVRAGMETYSVAGLEPETAYTYTVTSGQLTSAPVIVTTTAPIPQIQFLFDGTLEFFAEPGQPSDVAEIIADIENIPGDVSISVEAPFQLSTDKTEWTTRIVLVPGEERFYMRLFGSTEGEYTTALLAEADNFYDDDTDVDGTIAVPKVEPTFVETFEGQTRATYDEGEYDGNACLWVTNAYITKEKAHGGVNSARMNKNNPGFLTMNEDKKNGMGVLTLWARPWDSDASKYPVTLTVSTSADQGQTWEKAGEIIFSADDAANPIYRQYSLTINRRGSLRMKLEQDKVARTNIDDIALTDFISSGIEEAMVHEYHSWDAYCRNGRLVLESNAEGSDVANVYSIDGVERFAGTLPTGQTELNVAPGMYVVVVRDFARTVVVK